MDYEKKYKEALDKASVWHQQCIESEDTSRAERLENIFPELKESEDERMKKSFIRLVKAFYDVNFPTPEGFERKDMIAWLEKHSEQKPAWSEEDELHIRELESLVKQVWAIAERENDKETIHKMSNLSFFLKTLKPQLKQEWSEKDDVMINKLLAVVNLYYDRSGNDLDKKSCISFLKSLRPKNTWKPSDKQLYDLSYAINHFRCDGLSTEGLKKLLEQLKEL